MDVEAGDEGDNRRQVGLELGMDDRIDQPGLAIRAVVAGDVDDPIDLGRQGPSGPRVPGRTAGLLGVLHVLPAAERGRLAFALLLTLVQLPAELVQLLADSLQFPLLGSQLPLQLGDPALALLAAGAIRGGWFVTHTRTQVGTAPSPGKSAFVHSSVTMDEYISSYKDHSAAVDKEYSARLGNALTNLVVVDGRIVGTWKRSLEKGAVVIEVKLVSRSSRVDRGGVAEL